MSRKRAREEVDDTTEIPRKNGLCVICEVIYGGFRHDGKLYCKAHKPVGAVSTHACVGGCGKIGSFRYAGKRYCKACKPVGAVSIHVCAHTGCGKTGAYRLNGKYYCKPHEPVGAIGRNTCVNGCGVEGRYRHESKRYCEVCKPPNSEFVYVRWRAWRLPEPT
jgi:hypothetical protein